MDEKTIEELLDLQKRNNILQSKIRKLKEVIRTKEDAFMREFEQKLWCIWW